MAKIYNPTINSYIKEFDGNRYLEIPAGETREFTRIEADFLLKKFEWLIEANDYVPTELRSDERSDIEIFKKYWRRFKNNIGLRRNKHGNKYIIIGSKKFEIPNSETRNALGYDISDFPEEERLLDELDVGPSVTNVFNARLIRLKANPNPVYIVFEFPRLEKRHVPDQATLNAIRREQNEVDTLDKKEFDEIPTGEPIRQKSEWDTKGYVQITNKQDLESNIFNINKSQLHFGTGDNIRNKGKGTLSPKEQWWMELRPIARLLAQPGPGFHSHRA